jgi:hypothetical protein
MRSRCSLCVSVYSPIVARQRLGRNVTAVTKTHATINKYVGRVVLIRAVSYQKSRRLVLPRTSCFLHSQISFDVILVHCIMYNSYV